MRMLWWMVGSLLAMAPAVSVFALTVPALVSPADMDRGVSPSLTLSWDAVHGATRYRVELRSAHSRHGFVTSNLVCPLTDLPIATDFHWRVRAENSKGSGAWSAPFLFTTLRPELPGQLVLSVAGPASSSLYVLNANGSALRHLAPAFPHSHALSKAPLTDPMECSTPAYSPDGLKIAFCSTEGGSSALYLMNSDGSGVTRLTPDEAERECAQPRFTPDGKCLVFRYGGTVKQLASIDLAGGKPACVTEKSLGDIRHFALSPDGHHVACIATPLAGDAATGNARLYLLDLKNGAAKELADNADPNGDLCFSADGMSLAYTSPAGGTLPPETRLEARDGVPALLPLKSAHPPAFTRDGTRLFFIRTTAKEAALCSLPIDGGAVIDYAGNVQLPLAFSPDGRYLAYAVTCADHCCELYISALDGQHRYRLSDQRWQLTSFDWGCRGKAPRPAAPPAYQDIPVAEFG